MEKIEQPSFKTCYVCKYEGETVEVNCPNCRKPMKSKMQIKILGGLMMLIGFFLIALMGFIINFTNQAINGNSSTVRWNASPEETKWMLAVLYIVLLFGFSSTITGLWQLVTGRRNFLLLVIMFGLAFGLYFLAYLLPKIFS